jgi:hypothetical protein
MNDIPANRGPSTLPTRLRAFDGREWENSLCYNGVRMEAADRIEELESALDRALTCLALHGYQRCDIPACNCGSWHGGHAQQRLSEIGDALADAGIDLNGKTIIAGVRELATVLTVTTAMERAGCLALDKDKDDIPSAYRAMLREAMRPA